MNFFDYQAVKVWLTSEEICVELADGRMSSLPIAAFPLLKNASNKHKNQVQIINGYALYWPAIEEDLSVAGFFK